jgi:Protein of unknown function (DUF669)
MDFIVPSASKNTGVFAKKVYAEGRYRLEIKETDIDVSKADRQTLVLKTVIIEGPVQEDGTDVRMGAAFTAYLDQRLEGEEWKIQNDTTRIVQLCNALGLKIPKSDKIPVKEMAGKEVWATFKHSKPATEGARVYINVDKWEAVED